MRHILSFVKRDSRISKGQKAALNDLSPKFVLECNCNQILDFQEIFGNNNPVVLEIGFGNGDSLYQQAKLNPGLNFLGIEIYKSGVAKLLMLINNHDLKNIRIISSDALKILSENIPVNSIHKLQLFFPDPWPKARHHKRRIVREQFLDLTTKVLTKAGCLHIATDWENYAEHITKLMQTREDFEQISSKGILTRPSTKFEARGIKLGHNIFDFYYRVLQNQL